MAGLLGKQIVVAILWESFSPASASFIERTILIISIDFDDTYTKDPEFWDEVCKLAMTRNHKVYCVSARPEEHMPKVRESLGLIIGEDACFGTGLKPKRKWMKRKNIEIDVWIDDTPDAIVSDYYSRFVSK